METTKAVMWIVIAFIVLVAILLALQYSGLLGAAVVGPFPNPQL